MFRVTGHGLVCINYNRSGTLVLRTTCWQRKGDASPLHYYRETRVLRTSRPRLTCFQSPVFLVTLRSNHSGAFLFPLLDDAAGTGSSSSSSTRTGTSTSTGCSSPIQTNVEMVSIMLWCNGRARFISESDVNRIPVHKIIFNPARYVQEFIIPSGFAFLFYCAAELEIVDGLGRRDLRYPISVQVEG